MFSTPPHLPPARPFRVCALLLAAAMVAGAAGVALAAPPSEQKRYTKALSARHAALQRLAPTARKQARKTPPRLALVRQLDSALSAYSRAHGRASSASDASTVRAVAVLRNVASLPPGRGGRMVQLQAVARQALAHDESVTKTQAALRKLKGPARAAMQRSLTDMAARRHGAMVEAGQLASKLAARKTPLERMSSHLDAYLKAHPRGTDALTTAQLSPLFHVLRAVTRRPDPRQLGAVLPLALSAVAAEDAVIEARKRLQQVAAAEVLKRTGKDAGRVVLVRTNSEKGTPLGKSGLRRAGAGQLAEADFAPGASLVTIERDEKGEVTVVEAVVERKDGKVVVYDEARAKPTKASKASTKKASTKKASTKKASTKKASTSKTASKTASTTGKQSTGATGSAGSARNYVVTLADSETEVVTTTSDASVALFDMEAIVGEDLVLAGDYSCTEETQEGHANSLFNIYSSCVPIEYEEWEEPECTLQAEQDQVWFGTAPFCSASRNDCGKNGMVYVGSDPCGQSNKCTTGEKILCAPPDDDDVVTVYLGTAPFCNAKPSDCDDIGMQYVKRSTCEDNSENCCSIGKKVKCKTPDGDATPIWLGKAPFCNASPESCTERGWTYIESDDTGDGRKCATGTKVKCQP